MIKAIVTRGSNRGFSLVIVVLLLLTLLLIIDRPPIPTILRYPMTPHSPLLLLHPHLKIIQIPDPLLRTRLISIRGNDRMDREGGFGVGEEVFGGGGWGGLQVAVGVHVSVGDGVGVGLLQVVGGGFGVFGSGDGGELLGVLSLGLGLVLLLLVLHLLLLLLLPLPRLPYYPS